MERATKAAIKRLAVAPRYLLKDDIRVVLRQMMTYLYDLGDSWWVDVTLERIDPPDTSAREPVVLDGRGDAPEQYPSCDEEEW